ncbi:protein involved in meta-pathway of phenol degradation [Caballeronia terrestris]|uniref:Protein involved in meta-pathway of phenol degradation n=1 Tax=Caballeronia terrestris TaxID=1226301 RepID=A0A158J0J6_9BURK|nr:transporter [Caballeronia terrestris]SAL61840.1 protein involved in meta-pathway of phenol degradation [Caballeronia terrestris]
MNAWCSTSKAAIVTTAVSAALVASMPVHATEGGIGRPITGQQVTPYAGVVPPTSDWIVTLTTIFYEGKLGASKTIPIAGTVTAGLDYNVVYVQANLIKTWGITAGGWNFASSIGVPVQYTNASSFNGILPNDHSTEFADLFFVPVIAGYHLTKTDHIAFSVQMYAPSGAYNENRLANAGQNTWTFIPTVSYTKLFPAQDVELSVNYGVNFYTTNNATEYHNAPLSVLDVLALKRFKGGWGVGIVGGWIQQLGDDTGGLADRLGGASGNSVGLGPIVTWAGKVGKTPVSAAFRWVNEVEAHKRPRGNAVQLSVSATFE